MSKFNYILSIFYQRYFLSGLLQSSASEGSRTIWLFVGGGVLLLVAILLIVLFIRRRGRAGSQRINVEDDDLLESVEHIDAQTTKAATNTTSVGSPPAGLMSNTAQGQGVPHSTNSDINAELDEHNLVKSDYSSADLGALLVSTQKAVEKSITELPTEKKVVQKQLAQKRWSHRKIRKLRKNMG